MFWIKNIGILKKKISRIESFDKSYALSECIFIEKDMA